MMALAGTDFNQGRGTRDEGRWDKLKVRNPPSEIQNPPAVLAFYFEYIKVEYAACLNAESDSCDHLMKS